MAAKPEGVGEGHTDIQALLLGAHNHAHVHLRLRVVHIDCGVEESCMAHARCVTIEARLEPNLQVCLTPFHAREHWNIHTV